MMADLGAGDGSLCAFCVRQAASYRCPKCRRPYCGLPCYRSEAHADCSEDFYKDEFMDRLHSTHAPPEEKQRMLETLRRVEQELGENEHFEAEDGSAEEEEGREEEDEEREQDEVGAKNAAAERLLHKFRNLNVQDLSEQELWDVLSREEQATFASMVDSGDLEVESLLPKWTPWWISASAIGKAGMAVHARASTAATAAAASATATSEASLSASSASTSPLITVLGESSSSESHDRPKEAPVPQPLERSLDGVPTAQRADIPALHMLLGAREPSPLLLFGLVDLLVSYALVARFLLGDMVSDPLQSLDFLAAVSAVLDASSTSPPSDVQSAARGIGERIAKQRALASAQELLPEALDDAIRFLREPALVLPALADLMHLFKAARKRASKVENGSNATAKESLAKGRVVVVAGPGAGGAGGGMTSKAREAQAAERKATFYASWWIWWHTEGDLGPEASTDKTTQAACTATLVALCLEIQHVRDRLLGVAVQVPRTRITELS